MTNEHPYHLKSLQNAINVLNLFEEYPTLSLTQICQLLKMNKTIAFKLLYTLTENDFLSKNMYGQYVLGARVHSLGIKVKTSQLITPALQEMMAVLSKETDETIHLVTWEDDFHVNIVNELLPNRDLMVKRSDSAPRLVHLTSTGMALLSTKSDSDVINYATGIFEKDSADNLNKLIQDMLSEVQHIRQQGYAINNQRYNVGVSSIAMNIPPLHHQTRPVLSVSVSGPSERIAQKKTEIIATMQRILSSYTHE